MEATVASFYTVVRSQSGTWHMFDGDSRNNGFAYTTCKREVREREVREVPLDSYDDLVALIRGPRGGYRMVCGECAWPEAVSR